MKAIEPLFKKFKKTATPLPLSESSQSISPGQIFVPIDEPLEDGSVQGVVLSGDSPQIDYAMIRGEYLAAPYFVAT